MSSLRARLLLAASFVLAVFIALCGAALERAFRQAALEAQYDRMQGLVYGLLGIIESDANGALTLREANLPDPRLRQPQSGLAAALVDERGGLAWQSPGFPTLPLPAAPEVGQFVFDYGSAPDYFSIAFGIRWLDAADDPLRYSVIVIEDAQTFASQLRAYRGTLWFGLGLSAALLLAVLVGILHWGLQPLTHLAQELRGIEHGTREKIAGRYPRELAPLSTALNAMIAAERNQQTRYRNALGDLAHSLKTPLAVLRGGAGGTPVQEQVDRMQHIVDYQLKRAAAAGSRTLSEPVYLKPIAEKILAALTKVYRDKGMRFDNRIPSELRLRADSGDLFELLGNLLDNACKYGGGQVTVGASAQGNGCEITVDDNGPGFPVQPEKLLERGVRADTRESGQGIGLASVAELVKAYDGSLVLEKSPLGGGRVRVRL